MKPIAAFLLFSIAFAGTACSDPAAAAPEPKPATEAAEVQGTFNLNVGRTNDAQGGLNLNAESGGTGGLIIAPSESGGNFAGVEGLGIEIEDAPEAMLEPAPAAEQDDLVRLPPEN